MKKVYWLLGPMVSIFVAIMFSTNAFAFGIGDVKSWFGGVSLQVVAYIVTAILGIGVIAKKREWIAAILISVGALLKGIGDIPTIIGIAIADGKIDPEEIKNIKNEVSDIPALVKSVVACFKGK